MLVDLVPGQSTSALVRRSKTPERPGGMPPDDQPEEAKGAPARARKPALLDGNRKSERRERAPEIFHGARAAGATTERPCESQVPRLSAIIIAENEARNIGAGYGTGSIPMLLTRAVMRNADAPHFATANPHNQILVVAIQLGLIGTLTLLAMWIVHLRLFRGDGLISWIGSVAVVENMVGSLFNSHLGDFAQGWIHVFAVGILGGMTLRQAALVPAENVARGAAALDAR